MIKTSILREFTFLPTRALARTARTRAILTNFLTVSLTVLYPEERSIAEPSVKQLLTASKFSVLI